MTARVIYRVQRPSLDFIVDSCDLAAWPLVRRAIGNRLSWARLRGALA